MITTIALSPAVDKVYFADGFNAGGLYRVKEVIKSAGGKGINVARVASILGEEVISIGFKAGDTGSWLAAKLGELGVDVRFITVQGESRTNNNIIDRANNTETELLEVGPYINESSIHEFWEIFERSLNTTSVLVCSGGLPEGVPEDFYQKLIAAASSRNIKVILDSSGKMLEEGIKAKPYIIKPNARELSSLVGKTLESRDDVIDACRHINSLGVKIVTASLGGEGAMMVSEQQILYAKAPEIKVVNTIGSGDSMVAGLAAGIERGYEMEEAFKLGVACAAVNALFREIGFVKAEMVEKYQREIEVERL
ncbi:MAG TPA: 1-phosphofructokinase [Clostridia bacterium]|nr:1-phosphofructokinase [Clostridia bacterium]